MKKMIIILLKIVILIFSSSALADLRGGYSKQRLGLIVLTLLENYYEREPLALHFNDLPIEIDDDPKKLAMVPLLQILTYESVLSVESAVKTVSDDSGASLTTNVTYYHAASGLGSTKAKLGRVNITSIKSISSMEFEQAAPEQQRFDVTFEWNLINEAEWIWSKDLDSVKAFQKLREATEREQIGTAKFKYREEQWQLIEPPIILVE